MSPAGDTFNEKFSEYSGNFWYIFREYSVGFDVITVSENVSNLPSSFQKKSSGDYRYYASNIVSLHA